VKLALAGDTMLGRGVARAIDEQGPQTLVAPDVIATAAEADLFVLNLECCISARGTPWPDPQKPFFFRAPPAAAEALAHLGVDCVTLANNHALDYGREALLDTFEHLRSVGVRWVGAGTNEEEARAPVALEAAGLRVAVVAVSDHPSEYSARGDRPGIAFDDLAGGRLPDWLVASPRGLAADAVLVTPHWGPNMTARPTANVRAAAAALVEAGATLVAGHSAHVFHGVAGAVLYDLGDFLDDYAVHETLRNDLGLLFLVTLDERGPARLEAVPLRLDFCHTRLATGEDAAWIARRFERVCGELGTEVTQEDGRLVVAWRQ
jgi:poly-gamma-glutamate capsule biosynthesis protein CapA/YwtB (metallophosphatase superfamily)